MMIDDVLHIGIIFPIHTETISVTPTAGSGLGRDLQIAISFQNDLWNKNSIDQTLIKQTIKSEWHASIGGVSAPLVLDLNSTPLPYWIMQSVILGIGIMMKCTT